MNSYEITNTKPKKLINMITDNGSIIKLQQDINKQKSERSPLK
jgi:hypothetical protein